MNAESLATLVTEVADEKKAREVVVLKVGDLTSVADYFIICSGQSTIQVRAIADGILDAMEEVEAVPRHIEGYKHGHWVLLDYGDVVVHVFLADERDYYGIERLWRDAPQMKPRLLRA